MTTEDTITEVPPLVRGLTYEEMPVGQVFRTARRTVTETDLVNFVTWGASTSPSSGTPRTPRTAATPAGWSRGR